MCVQRGNHPITAYVRTCALAGRANRKIPLAQARALGWPEIEHVPLARRPPAPAPSDLPRLHFSIPPETTPAEIQQVVMSTRGTARRLNRTTLALTPDPRISDQAAMTEHACRLGWRLLPDQASPGSAMSIQGSGDSPRRFRPGQSAAISPGAEAQPGTPPRAFPLAGTSVAGEPRDSSTRMSADPRRARETARRKDTSHEE